MLVTQHPHKRKCPPQTCLFLFNNKIYHPNDHLEVGRGEDGLLWRIFAVTEMVAAES